MENIVLWLALALYVAAGGIAIAGVIGGRRFEHIVLTLLVAALIVHTGSLTLRWERLGHGPFNNMFEILSSGIWSMTLIYTIAYASIRALRPTAALIMPVIFLMMAWMLFVGARDSYLPPTYATIWLYVHVGVGKIFRGLLFTAVGLAGVILLRASGHAFGLLRHMPDDVSLEELAFRFMAVALIFDSLMLLAGAIWAQDAWGRYWGWDPLEIWSFVTWLTLGFALHLRLTLRPRPVISAAMVCVVFLLAFLTFYGVPFLSPAPHKGAV